MRFSGDPNYNYLRDQLQYGTMTINRKTTLGIYTVVSGYPVPLAH